MQTSQGHKVPENERRTIVGGVHSGKKSVTNQWFLKLKMPMSWEGFGK